MTRLEPPTLRGSPFSPDANAIRVNRQDTLSEDTRDRGGHPRAGSRSLMCRQREPRSRDLEGYGRSANRVDRTPFAPGILGANTVDSSTEMP